MGRGISLIWITTVATLPGNLGGYVAQNPITHVQLLARATQFVFPTLSGQVVVERSGKGWEVNDGRSRVWAGGQWFTRRTKPRGYRTQWSRTTAVALAQEAVARTCLIERQGYQAAVGPQRVGTDSEVSAEVVRMYCEEELSLAAVGEAMLARYEVRLSVYSASRILQAAGVSRRPAGHRYPPRARTQPES